MAASYAGAKAAIRQRLVDGWATTPITYQNEVPADPFPPKDNNGDLKPFVLLEILGTGSSIVGQGTPGNHLWRYTGLIQVHVYVPSNTGDGVAGAYADLIGELFRNATFYADETHGAYVRSWSPRQDGGDSGDDSGNWFRVTETIDFEYWHRG